MKIVRSEWIRGVRLLALGGAAAVFLLSCAHAAEPSQPSRTTNAPTHESSEADHAGWQCSDRLADAGSVSSNGTVDLAVGERATLTDGATIAIECERVENTCPPGRQCFVGPITHLKVVLTTADGQRAEGDFTYHEASKQHVLAGSVVSLVRSADEAGQPKRHRLHMET